MDQGLTQSLHERYPAMHKDYQHWCHMNHPQPGEAWLLWVDANGRFIANLITQEGGYAGNRQPDKATTTHLNHALRALKKIIGKEKVDSLALPRLATGIGGLDWEHCWP